MKAIRLFLMSVGIVGASQAYAIHVDVTPGLWEHTINMKNMYASDPKQQEQMEKAQQAMEKMKEQMANMPPETRKMMEQVMEKNKMKIGSNGIQTEYSKMEITKDGTKIKVCVSKEDSERGDFRSQRENCTQQITELGARTYKVVFECKASKDGKGTVESKGESIVNFVDSKSYSGKTTMTTNMQGKEQAITTEQSGRWLSSDCGDIKPYKPKDQAAQ